MLSEQGPTEHLRCRTSLGTAGASASAMGPGGGCTARPDSNSEQRGEVEASGLPWAEVTLEGQAISCQSSRTGSTMQAEHPTPKL